MLRLTLLVLLVCLTGIVVGYPTHDSSDGDHSHDADDRSIDLQNGTCLEKAERVLKYLWARYKVKHGLKFHRAEELRRLAIFRELLEIIQLHNRQADIGEHSFRMGLTALSALTSDEFKKMRGFIPSPKRSSEMEFKSSLPLSALPATVNWVTAGWVTSVKNQGQCGSCYTFAAAGAMEGQLMNTTQQLISLSEQQLLDCSSNRMYGNQGCNGGLYDNVFKYAKATGYVDTYEAYPYTGKQGPCRASPSMAAQNSAVTSWVNVARGSPASLQQAIATIGPTAIAIDASSRAFQSYTGGIYSCKTKPQLDHAVLAVGYGSDGNGQDYWLVKNSWGTTWGEQGYFKLARNSQNPYADCGATLQASAPLM